MYCTTLADHPAIPTPKQTGSTDATGSAIESASGDASEGVSGDIGHADSDGMNSRRVAWLEKAYRLLREELLPEAPERVTITFGFPSKGARPSRNQRIGEYAHFLKDCEAGPGLLTLHPTVFDKPARVLDVLLHEMIHAARPMDGHRGQFPKLAKRVGLVGKMTATVAGPELKAKLETWLRDRLPLMPNGHGDLSADRKRQSTRLRKYVCPSCGQIIRAATDCLNAVCADCDAHFVQA